MSHRQRRARIESSRVQFTVVRTSAVVVRGRGVVRLVRVSLEEDALVTQLDLVVHAAVERDENEQRDVEIQNSRGDFEDFRMRVFGFASVRLKRERERRRCSRLVVTLDILVECQERDCLPESVVFLR